MQQNKIFKTPSLKTKAYCKVMILRNKKTPNSLKERNSTQKTHLSHAHVMKLGHSLKHSAAKDEKR